MSLRINNNVAAANAHRSLSVTSGQMSKSLEKLSSGFRINRAADDAAGLSISEGLRAQIGGLKVAVRNAQDGISLTQTAEGALTEVHATLQRMRDLAVQASNSGATDATSRTATMTEFTQLNAELNRIGSTASFGGQKLLDGSYGATTATVAGALTGIGAGGLNLAATPTDFVIGGTYNGTSVVGTGVYLTAATYATASAYQAELQTQIDSSMTTAAAGAGVTYTAGHVKATVIDSGNGVWNVSVTNTRGDLQLWEGSFAGDAARAGLRVAAVSANTGSGGVFQLGAKNSAAEQIRVSIDAVSASALGTSSLDILNAAPTAISALDTAIAKVSSTRAQLGAYQNRFERTTNNLNVAVENLSASESRIRDTDMAQEMVAFTRSQILSQAGTAMLAQANQSTQGVLSLLR